jgi:hypothetical protein
VDGERTQIDTITLISHVPVEPGSWGLIKSLYR